MAIAQAIARRTGQIPLQTETDSTWLLILLSLPYGAPHSFVSGCTKPVSSAVAPRNCAVLSPHPPSVPRRCWLFPNAWRFFSVQRDFVVFSLALAPLLLMAEREIVRRSFSAARRRGHRLRRVVIVGDNAEARELRRMFERRPLRLATNSSDYVTVDRIHAQRPARMRFSAIVDDIIDIVQRRDAASVMIAASAVDVAHTNPLIRELLKEGVHVELSPTLPDIAVERLTIKPSGSVPGGVPRAVPPVRLAAGCQTGFDFACSAFGLTVLALPLLTLALLIKVDSRGPIFYAQTRVGKNGRLFSVVKFRTMVPNAHQLRHELAAMNEADGPLFKIKHDPRVTRVGRLLRKTSLDELPQLWNVLRGEMSLVGPRPALPEEARLWDPELRDRLRVQPGITGMWQVSGRSNTSFDEYSRLDLYYVDNWSLLTDLSILIKTLPAVVAQRGAA